jgi:carboxyl-terminal processing protease
VGDEVASIDGEPFERFFARRERYLSGSSERWRRRSLTRYPYLFPARFTLKLADGRAVEVVRARTESAPAAASDPVPNRWLGADSVAYLRVPYFGEERYEARALELLGTRYRGARALVLDLRGNGGGDTPWKLRKALTGGRGRRWKVLHDNAPPSLLQRVGAPVVIRAARVPRFRGRLVVLTDGGCYSACEDLVGGLRGLKQVTVVGDTTGGSTGQPVVTSFGNGMNARVSARRYLLPDGAPFEGVGVAPDVLVPRTVESLRDGSDPALERATALARVPPR